MKKVDFYVWDGSKEINASGGCSCGGQEDVEMKSMTFDDQISMFSEKFKKLASFNTSHAKQMPRQELIDRLNSIFSQNKESLSISEASYDFVISKILPIVLVNNKIISMGSIPNEENLYKAIQTEKKIGKSSSCCS